VRQRCQRAAGVGTRQDGVVNSPLVCSLREQIGCGIKQGRQRRLSGTVRDVTTRRCGRVFVVAGATLSSSRLERRPASCLYSVSAVNVSVVFIIRTRTATSPANSASALSDTFYPRDAVPARYMLCEHRPMYMSPVAVLSKQLDRSGWLLVWASFTVL